MLVTVDFELGPFIAEFGRAQHVTGPEVVLACPAEQHAHVAVVTSVTFTHQADIVSPPSKIRFNDETMQEINTLLIALDKTWDDDLLPLCSQIFRRDIRASSELTQAEAVKALGFLKQKASEQKVAA